MPGEIGSLTASHEYTTGRLSERKASPDIRQPIEVPRKGLPPPRNQGSSLRIVVPVHTLYAVFMSALAARGTSRFKRSGQLTGFAD